MRFGPVQHTLRCLTRSSPTKQTGATIAPACAQINTWDHGALPASCSRQSPTSSSVPRPDHPSVKANQLAANWLPSNALPTRRHLCAATIAPRYVSTATDEATTSSSRDADPSAAVPSLQELEDSIGQLSTAATVPALRPLVIVISGPSGVGKDAVIKQLQSASPNLHFVVTATTRPRRANEVDGVDYVFVSREVFSGWVSQGAMLEHAIVYGDYKGIPREHVEAALARGTDVVLRLDVQGAATVRRLMPDCVSIFLVAETERELVGRLVSRKTEPLDSMLIRIQTARDEMDAIRDFDYVVVNRANQLEQTVSHINAIIMAEKLRACRQIVMTV